MGTMGTGLELNQAVFAGVRHIAPKVNERYSLNGAYVHRVDGAGRADITDGRILVRIPLNDAEMGAFNGDAVLLDGDDIRARGSKKAHRQNPGVLSAGSPLAATVEHGPNELSRSIRVSDGHFPNADDVMPDEKGTVRVAFNAGVLAKVLKFAQEATAGIRADEGPVVTFYIKDGMSGVKFDMLADGRNIIDGVVMPCQKAD
jgi:hypothetical protein